VTSFEDFAHARLVVDPAQFIPPDVAARIAQLPSSALIRDREISIDYDVEERDGARIGVARLRLPEKIARTLTDVELPALDRPLRFVVLRGQRGAVRADSLVDLHEQLERPWSPGELEDAGFEEDLAGKAEREVRKVARQFRDGRPRAPKPRQGGKGEKPSGRGRSRRRR